MSESTRPRRVAVPALVGAAALTAAAALIPADWIGSAFVGEAPEAPALNVGPREPLTLVVGIDATKSAIKDKIPGIVTVTSEALGQGGMLQAGDHVRFCEVGTERITSRVQGPPAVCTDFEMEQGRTDLLAAIGEVDVEDGDMTHLRPALELAIEGLDSSGPTVGVLWSDAQEEATRPATVQSPFPWKLMIPDQKFREGADDLCTKIKGADCDVELVRTAEDFKEALQGFVGQLEATARAEAEAVARRLIADQTRAFEEREAEYQAKVKAIQTKIRVGIGALLALIISGTVLVVRQLNRPELEGVLVNIRGRFPERKRLKRHATSITIPSKFGGGELKATRKGLMLNGDRLVQSGDQISEGVYYFSADKVPNDKDLKRLKAGGSLSGSITTTGSTPISSGGAAITNEGDTYDDGLDDLF